MNPEFQVHMLNERGKKNAQAIAEAFDRCLETLSEMCAGTPAFQIAKWKMEEACFFAKKAMAGIPENTNINASGTP